MKLPLRAKENANYLGYRVEEADGFMLFLGATDKQTADEIVAMCNNYAVLVAALTRIARDKDARASRLCAIAHKVLREVKER